MKHPSRISIEKVWTFLPCLVLVVAACIAAPCLYGQSSSPDDTQYGVMSSLDQNTLYPVQTQMAETSNLNSMNQNADTVKYSDAALTRGPFFFSVDTTGTWTTNLQNSFDNQAKTSGGYITFGVPAGLHLSSPTSDFSAYFQFNTNVYPGNSDLNHSSEVYSHQLIHQYSDTTTTSWSVAAGHIVTLGYYLSPVIGVGTTGVVAPQQHSGLEPLTDAATTYSVSHQTSERNSWTASGTVGWLDQPVLGITPGITTKYQQFTGGADFQWQRALNSREIAGVEVTNVYIDELTPSGTGNFTSAKITFGQTLTPHSSITAGIGPLYSTSNFSGGSAASIPGGQQQNLLTYAANVGFDYRLVSSSITGGYARVIELGYNTPASMANELYFTFDHPISSKMTVTAASQYVSSAAFEGRNNYAQFALTARLDMHFTPTLDYHVEGSTFIQDTGAPTPGYSANQIATGITFYFGNPLSRGVQQ